MDDILHALIGLAVMIGFGVLIFFGIKSFSEEITKDLITHAEYYKGKGVLGPHELSVIDPTKNQISGSLSGSAGYFLILGGGEFKGEVHSSSFIEFMWTTPDGLDQVVDIPYFMVKWDLDDRNTTPTFEFNFTQNHLNSSLNKYVELINFNQLFEKAEAITIHCTSTLFFQDVESKISK